jgi:ubiquitin carboxyl-terminal hydrolase 25/28
MCNPPLCKLNKAFPQHPPFDLSLEHTLEFLSQEELIPPSEGRAELIHQLSGEPALVKAELDELRTRAVQLKEELESIWQGCEAATYELTSVFVHRGSSPSWGHYFFYSRHLPGHPDSWFRYNDSDVTVVSKEEVLSDTTGQTANPYLVCVF